MTTKFKIVAGGGFIKGFNNSEKKEAESVFKTMANDCPWASIKLIKVTETVLLHHKPPEVETGS